MTQFFTPANVIASGWLTSGADMVQIAPTKRILAGLTSSDQTGAQFVTKTNLSVVDLAANATIISLGVQTGALTFISSEKTGTGTYQPLAFFLSGTEKARIQTDGLTGIGTSAPAVLLHTKYGADSWIIYAERSSGAITGLYSSTTVGRLGTESNHPAEIVVNSTTVGIHVAVDGKVGINNTSPTQKLDVTGDVVFSGRMQSASINVSGGVNNTITGTGIHAITLFSNSVGSSFKIHIGQTTAVTDNYIGLIDATDLGILINNTVTHAFFSTGNVSIGNTTDSGYKLDVTGTARFNNDTRFEAAVTLAGLGMTIFSTLKVGSLAAITSCAVAEFLSTSLGVLLPRMTTAQRNAISSPVAGLVIYNTTTNKLNVYTTVWEAVTSA